MSALDQLIAVLIGIDQAASAALFTTGNCICISSRAGMALMDAKNSVYDPNGPHGIEAESLRLLAYGLDDIQVNHCIESIQGDVDRCVAAIGVLMPYQSVTKV